MSLFGKYNVMLAPMAGITNLPFRLICEDLGCDLAFSEMVSSMGLTFANQKTKRLIDSIPKEKKLGVQLFGHDPKIMSEQAKKVQFELEEKLSHIDINMGCPARKIIKKGDGASLMKNPTLASKIVSSIKKAIDIPLSVKFRRGFYEGEETCVGFAKIMEESGADAICVHGRFAMQYYKGSSDMQAIKRVKESVKVPIVGNGDVFTWEDYSQMIETTKCDAVLIARGATKNPLLFRQIKEYMSGLVPQEISIKDRMNIAIKHAQMIESLKGDHPNISFLQFRKQAMNYCEGIPGAKVARTLICKATACSQFVKIFSDLS